MRYMLYVLFCIFPLHAASLLDAAFLHIATKEKIVMDAFHGKIDPKTIRNHQLGSWLIIEANDLPDLNTISDQHLWLLPRLFEFLYEPRVGMNLREKFVSVVEKRAESGNYAIQSCYGYMCYYGVAIHRSPKDAVKWYKKSAQTNHANMTSWFETALSAKAQARIQDSIKAFTKILEKGNEFATKGDIEKAIECYSVIADTHFSQLSKNFMERTEAFINRIIDRGLYRAKLFLYLNSM